MKSLTTVFVPALLSSALALSFVPPFDTKSGFELSGNAAVSGNAVLLAQKPRQSGAVWMSTPVKGEEWTLEAVLRSTADLNTDIGASGFTLWYTTKPNPLGPVHGGAEKWDGLAVMMDSVGTTQSVRGHLSDGSYQFGGDVEKDALSLCRIDYRNAAVPITLRVGYSAEGFVVDINGSKCFMTTEISLPTGYFGVSANSDGSGDVLSVERLEVFNHMKPDIAAHLPQHADERRSTSESKQQEGKTSGSETTTQVNQGVDPAALQAALNPILSRLEFVDQKLSRLDSVVNQLVDTLTLSLAQVSGDRSSGFSDSGPEVQQELQLVRSQLSEIRKATYSQASSDVSGASTGPSIWTIVFVVMALQLVAVFVHNTLTKRSQYDRKLV